MPSNREHRVAAARHLRAYRSNRSRHPDWAAVMLFYAALHLFESVFDGEGQHNNTHSDRGLYIKSRHQGAWIPYSRLQNESMKARYLQGGRFMLNNKQVHSELFRQNWKKVRAYLGMQLMYRRGGQIPGKSSP